MGKNIKYTALVIILNKKGRPPWVSLNLFESPVAKSGRNHLLNLIDKTDFDFVFARLDVFGLVGHKNALVA